MNELGASRHFVVTKGKEMAMKGAPNVRVVGGEHAAHGSGGHGMENPKPGDIGCSPTWAQPSADGSKVYVACNKSNDIPEIDVATGVVTRRIPARNGVYNLAHLGRGCGIEARYRRDH